MINGITPKLKPETEFGISFDEAVNNLLGNIQACYDNWRDGTKYGSMKTLDLSLNKGRKFVKVVEGSLGQRRVWGFVSLVDGTHKGLPLKKGDIMKAAGWSGVAKHSRGSIFDTEVHKSFSWTGPNYL